MELGIVGKPNIGKSTFLSAATLAEVEISNYPFTTVKPNVAVGYATTECPCRGFEVKCSPQNSQCLDGTRLIPIRMIDVAGLVPGAHKGKGLGLSFLDNLRQASALVHILDISGSTDNEGKICKTGEHDPVEDIKFLEEEVDQWLFAIMKKLWEKIARRIQYEHEDFYKSVAENLGGIGISEEAVRDAVKELKLDPGMPADWSDGDILAFTKAVRQKGKPIIIAANKADIPDSGKNMKKLKEKFPELLIEPCSAESELALRRAAKQELIEYTPGDKSFKVLKDLPAKQKDALDFIQEKVLDVYNSTGVQQIINTAVYDLLDLVPVYPVEDENKLADKKGNVLPDVYLLPKGSTPVDLAYKIHTDIGDNFIAAIDARTKKKIGKDTALKAGDVVKIVAKA